MTEKLTEKHSTELSSPRTAAVGRKPYPPSSIDRLNARLRAGGKRGWWVYLLVGLGLVAVQVLALGLAGGGQAREILPVIVFNGLFTPFLLGLMAGLDEQAAAALQRMRPVLEIDQGAYEGYRYQLTHMPAPRPLLAGGALLALVIVMEQLWVVPLRYAALEQFPVFAVVFQVVDKSSAFLFGVVLYHTVRQLRLVDRIQTHSRVNLYHLGPLRAFSRLTAATAVGLVAGVYGWLLINPELLADPVILAFAALVTLLAGAVFIWPLYGVQRRMAAAKEQALQELDQRFEAAFERFNRQFAAEDFAALERLNGTIASLETQLRKIEAISTWPWRPETARSALGAIVLPLVLMILRAVIEQLLGW